MEDSDRGKLAVLVVLVVLVLLLAGASWLGLRVLDRLDGIVVAAVVATAIGLFINFEDPARALIFWN